MSPLGAMRVLVVEDEVGLAKLVRQGLRTEGMLADVAVTGTGGGDVPADVGTAVYRIVQEALTNAAKYAEASNIDITLNGHEVLSLIIVDDGQGFDQDKVVLGMGLSGIRDRVNMLQGSVTISSRPGKGTSIHVEFPRVTGYRRRLSDRISY